MNLLNFQTIAALLVFVASIATIIYPLRRRSALEHPESIELGEAFASGIFLGASFFHMLPDSIRGFRDVYPALSYPLPEFICIAGFLFLQFLEQFVPQKERLSQSSIPYVFALILIIHALAEGAALGLVPTFPEALMIFIAIMAHKGSESFALCVLLLRHQLPIKRILFAIIFFSFMTPIGILLGTAVSQFKMSGSVLIEAIFNAFVAGTFLYMSTLHHVRFHHHDASVTQSRLAFLSLLTGLLLMGLLAWWA